MLRTGSATPQLSFPLAKGGQWTLAAHPIRSMLMVSIFRGAFCRFCREFLVELDTLAPEFDHRGIDIVAASTDEKKNKRRQ